MKKWKSILGNVILPAIVIYGFYIAFTQYGSNYAARVAIVQSIQLVKDNSKALPQTVEFQYTPCMDCSNLEQAQIKIDDVKSGTQINFLKGPKSIMGKSLIISYSSKTFQCLQSNIDPEYLPKSCRKI